ncbi:MAG: SusF/SusE family outer membrane protein [Bacteroidales bacterium]|nr:SusF/SusE family outer membrane protein [Bacteroidales bacterium]
MNKIKYLLIVLVAVFIYSCQEDFDTPPAPPTYNNVGPVVTNGVDDTTAVLLKENEDVAWDTLAWNAAVLYEGQGLITHYAVQIDEQGNNFGSMFEIEGGTTSATEIVITVGNLNTKLLANGYSPAETYDLELRIKARVHDDLDSVYSNVHSFTVTTYKDIPVPEALFLFGDATTVGWGADTSLATYKEEGKYTIFTYLENDKQFRFLEAQELEGEDNFKYNFNSFAVLPDNVDDAGDDDNNFKFTGATGWYKIEADYLASTLTIAEHTVGAATYTYDYDNLYIVGDYNATDPVWDAENAVAFTKVSEGIFTIEKEFKDGAMFKFLGQQSWGDLDWGNIGGDGNSGTLGPKEFNGNITFDGGDETYAIEVNIKQGTYTFTKTAKPPLYVVGSYNGWNESTALEMNKDLDGKNYELYVNLVPNEWGFKLLPTLGSWDGDMGDDPSNPGHIIADGEANMHNGEGTTDLDGYYLIKVNLGDMTWGVTEIVWGLIGSATPGGWDSDTDLTYDDVNDVWILTEDLVIGEIKFRANDGWDINFGDTGADGNLEAGGDNIAIAEDGNYTVTMSLGAAGDYTYTVVKN